MSKRRQLTPLAIILRLLPQLGEAETTTLRDVLRPEPAPRKKAKAKVAPGPKPAMCGVCGQPEEASDHDLRYSSSHKFVAPGAAKRSRRPSATVAQSATSATATDSAGDAATASGAGGD